MCSFAVVEHFLVDAVKSSLALVNNVALATAADAVADAVDDKDEGFLSGHSWLSEFNFYAKFLYPMESNCWRDTLLTLIALKSQWQATTKT